MAFSRAVPYFPETLRTHVRNAAPAPEWLPGEDRFCYHHDLPDGGEYRLVDAETGACAPAFDHAALARALESQAGLPPCDPRHLPIHALSCGPRAAQIHFAPAQATGPTTTP